MDLDLILILISGLSFIFYGITSFFSKKMSLEYKRWGYEDQRYLIGALQFIGGLSLLTGLYIRVLIPLSAGSLMLLMLSAVGVRIKIGDQPLLMIPALFYAVLNFLILINSTF